MVAPLLPPVPPIGKDGFQDPVWPKWLANLHSSVTTVVTNPSAIAVASANGFSGSVVQPPGGVATITVSATTSGILKGNGQQLIPAVAGIDYLVTNLPITLTGDVTGNGTINIPTTLSANFGAYAENLVKLITIPAGTQSILAVNLAAGDWDVTGVVTFSSAVTSAKAGVSTNNTNFGGFGSYVLYTTNSETFSLPTVRVSFASASVVYLMVNCTFTGTSCTGEGFLRARRVR
jgi:hypothetical protein